MFYNIIYFISFWVFLFLGSLLFMIIKKPCIESNKQKEKPNNRQFIVTLGIISMCFMFVSVLIVHLIRNKKGKEENIDLFFIILSSLISSWVATMLYTLLMMNQDPFGICLEHTITILKASSLWSSMVIGLSLIFFVLSQLIKSKKIK